MGGDEVPSTVLSQTQYASFINQESTYVNSIGKEPMGWADIAGPGTTFTKPAIAEYWNPDSGTAPGTVTGTEAVQKGMKVVMAPANHTYLDQKYKAGMAGNVPPSLGLSWACGSGCDVDQFYNWDPATYVTGVTDANVIGAEGAIWGETTVTFPDVEYMVFPRLVALAEVAWSPEVARTATSPAYQDFLQRLAAQGGRFLTSGVNFYPTPEATWRLDLEPARIAAVSGRDFSGALAKLAAPGFATSAVTATVSWGDGSSSAGSVTGTGPTSITVNGLYSVTGTHAYAHPGVYHGTVTVSASGATATTTKFTVVVTH
jgi:hexosaminidase